MDNERLDLIIFLVSELRNISRAEAESLIMSTETGKAIKLKDESVMYEQDIANLAAIYEELMYAPFQPSNIYKLMKDYERECNEANRRKAEQIKKCYCKISDWKERYRLRLNQKEAYKQKLQKRKREFISIGRVRYAIKIKG